MTQDKPIQTVLAATDFSNTAQAGIDWAVEVARTQGARIVLVHGLMLPGPATDFVPSPLDVTEELQQAASGRLNEAAERTREKNIEVKTDLRLGLPSMAIVEAAEENGADLIVLGTRGLTGLKHLFLGSTAERVVQHATCPVLSVHPGDIDQHRQFRTVLAPTDFSSEAELGISTVLDFLSGQAGETTLILLHVYHLPYEYTAYGTIPTSVDYFKDVEGAAEERLEALAEPLQREGLKVHSLALEGFPPEVIVGEAAARGADLIAMGTHGRSGIAHLFLGSTAERVVQRARCPVLTVRRTDQS